MKDLKLELEEILEIQDIDLTKKFDYYPEWDSLSSLTLVALLDSDYNITMSYTQLDEFKSIGEFCKYVEEHAK